ncbi:rhomboid protease GluP [Flavobacterium sp. 103]|uniref:rhomboid family intramembrane serine protease n=1 Tax=Flavobacterium sp. 103 TaxID=2135624 RepID=UPI000D5E6B39|nr:rhomboid family intramembrane serine protease [Flavobacterium sp. 103]PVX44884.1 rhomboid protease GluP [Flavobacterium sp. 103]
MAFGFPSSFLHGLPLNNLSKNKFIFKAIEISKKLNWQLIEINKKEITFETVNSQNTWNEKIHITIETEAAYFISSSNGNQIYDKGRNKKNIEAFLELFYEADSQNENLEFSENLLSEYITTLKNNILNQNTEAIKTTRFYSFFSIFIPTKNYFITPILINLNILIFILMGLSGVNIFIPEIQEIIDWGGNYGPLTTENEWWRLLSSCFIHFGIIHLFMNCISLAYIGLLLEPYMEKWQLLTTYLFCGILASITSLYWNDNLVSAGASGAIFGLCGILIIFVLFKKLDEKLNSNLLLPLISLISINLLSGYKDGIDGAAHIGGFLSGILFGIILALLDGQRKKAIIAIYSVSIPLIIALSIICRNSKMYIYQTMEYENRMQDFVDMEKMALEAYGSSSSKEQMLYMIKDRGIYYWEENIKLIKELDKLYLPEKIHINNKNLIEYCKLRTELYELAYNKLNENTDKYDSKIGYLNSEITKIMTVIKNNSTQEF